MAYRAFRIVTIRVWGIVYLIRAFQSLQQINEDAPHFLYNRVVWGVHHKVLTMNTRFGQGLISLGTFLFVLSSCNFDDSALWNAVNENTKRIVALEKKVEDLNEEVSTLRSLLDALGRNDTIINVSELTDGTGYTISFQSGKSIVIHHGRNGGTPQIGVKQDEDGKWYWTLNGDWLLTESGEKIQAKGEDGTNGIDGKDGVSPKIDVRQDSDGKYYWTLNGEWILNENGEKILAQGKDGENGTTPRISIKQDTDGLYYWTLNGEWLLDDQGEKVAAQGANGINGITPKFKIVDNYWYLSYDNEASWIKLGKASGNNGLNGENGDSFFCGVAIKDGYVEFTLNDETHTVIKLPYVVSGVLAVNLDEAGTLKEHLSLEQRRNTLELKISGYCDDKNDMLFVNTYLNSLEVLDLADATCFTTYKFRVNYLGREYDDGRSYLSSNKTIRKVRLGHVVYQSDPAQDAGGAYISDMYALDTLVVSANNRGRFEISLDSCPNLSTIVFEEGITCPEHYEIYYIQKVLLPSTLTAIWENFFCIGATDYQSKTRLRTVVCNATTPPKVLRRENQQVNSFYNPYGCLEETTLYVPKASLSLYKSHSAWSQFGIILPIEN